MLCLGYIRDDGLPFVRFLQEHGQLVLLQMPASSSALSMWQ